MSESIVLNVTPREIGKHNSRALRKSKMVPAIVYGNKINNRNLSAIELQVVKYSNRKYENSIFKLKSEDSELDGLNVLLKDISRHPVNRRPVHVDFYAIDLAQVVRVSVELNYIGKPIGAQEGGLLTIVARHIELECKASDIPKSIDVDVSGLNINETIHLSDIKLPDGVTPTATDNVTLAGCSAVKEEEVAATPAIAEGAVEGEAAAAGKAGAAATPAAADAKKDKKD